MEPEAGLPGQGPARPVRDQGGGGARPGDRRERNEEWDAQDDWPGDAADPAPDRAGYECWPRRLVG